MFIGSQLGMVAGAKSATGSITDHAVNPTNQSSFSFSSMAIGTADSTRIVVVGVFARISSGSAFTAFTIGGVNATQAVFSLPGGSSMAAIYFAVVPTGTTGTVAFTWNGTLANAGIGVAACYDMAATTTDTGTAIGDPMTDTLNIPAGGLAFGCAGETNSSTFTWTNLTEGYDEVVEGIATQTGAIGTFSAIQVGLTITCDQSGGNTDPVLVLASWGPA